MTRGAGRTLLGLCVVGLAACFLDLGGPTDEITSISNLRLPSPSVVVGDLLRDSMGNPAPLTLTAFDGNGQPRPDETALFISLDTTVQIDDDGTVHGLYRDSVGARIIATAHGLQTPPQRLVVTVAPTSAATGTDATTVEFVNTLPDTSTSSNWSPPLVLTLLGAGGLPAQGFVVTYRILEMPDAEVPGTVTAYIGNDAARPMLRDTTDNKGVASRRVILRQSAVANDIRAGTRPDTVIVEATVRYLGADAPGTPVQFIVPVSKKP